jgi:hypothetical protein
MKKNLVMSYAVIAVVALAIIGGGVYWYAQTKNIYAPLSPTNTQAGTNTQAPNVPAKTTPAISYSEALKIYADHRLQFGFNSYNYCTVVPNNAVFKKGTKIMLDNRAGKQITVYLDEQPYNINKYDFKIATLTTSAALPHTIKISCGTEKNNASIYLVQ